MDLPLSARQTFNDPRESVVLHACALLLQNDSLDAFDEPLPPCTGRFLQDLEGQYDTTTTVVQVFSGFAFMFFGIWMTWMNSRNYWTIQKAHIADRMAFSCNVCLFVTTFSCFFNFFQVTELDNIALTDQRQGFTLDLARPIEWIFTCPLMQYVVVVLGGPHIPEYRRVLMPLLSVAVLGCGSASLLTEKPLYLRFFWYVIGFSVAMIMFSLNRAQVLEHSGGMEDFWRPLNGSGSYFWKASVLLVITWFPFPIWFALSPEGLGVIESIPAVQLGWGVLNIVSKFSFMGLIQYIKTTETCRRDKRWASGQLEAGFGERMEEYMYTGEEKEPKSIADGSDMERPSKLPLGPPPSNVPPPPSKGRMMARMSVSDTAVARQNFFNLVLESLANLGMEEHAQRFLKLLSDKSIDRPAKLKALTESECNSKGLPWSIVCAVQKTLPSFTNDAEMDNMLAFGENGGGSRGLSKIVPVYEGSMKEMHSPPEAPGYDCDMSDQLEALAHHFTETLRKHEQKNEAWKEDLKAHIAICIASNGKAPSPSPSLTMKGPSPSPSARGLEDEMPTAMAQAMQTLLSTADRLEEMMLRAGNMASAGMTTNAAAVYESESEARRSAERMESAATQVEMQVEHLRKSLAESNMRTPTKQGQDFRAGHNIVDEVSKASSHCMEEVMSSMKESLIIDCRRMQEDLMSRMVQELKMPVLTGTSEIHDQAMPLLRDLSSRNDLITETTRNLTSMVTEQFDANAAGFAVLRSHMDSGVDRVLSSLSSLSLSLQALLPPLSLEGQHGGSQTGSTTRRVVSKPSSGASTGREEKDGGNRSRPQSAVRDNH